MRGVLVGLLVFGFGLTCVAPSSSATPAAGASQLARLFGSWDCEGLAAGSSSVETYARQNDESVTLTNRVHTSVGSEGTIVETFVFDPARGDWTLNAAANPLFGGLQLSGARWSGDRWVLTGTEVVQNAPRPVRIVYTSLANGAFRREHQAQTSTGWTDDGEFVCKRSGASPAPLAAVPAVAHTPAVIAAGPSATPSNSPRATLPTPSPVVATVAPATFSSPSVAPTQVLSPSATPPTAASRIATRAPAKLAARLPSRTPQPLTTQPADHAFALVGAAWSCESVGGQPSTHRYTRSGDDAITLHDDVRVAQHTYAIVETYRFDPARSMWTTAVQGGGYNGTASPWLHSKWTFDGIETERGRRSAVRMIYTTLGDRAFRRDFQLAGSGEGQTFVSETCTRS